MTTTNFLAGAAKVDITPPLGTYINGDFIPHYAQYIHDNLFAKSLVMQQGDELIAIVVVDICVMSKDFLNEVKRQILEQIAIQPEKILISSTHTHAAGSVAAVYLGAADLQYIAKLPRLIVESVLLAKKNMRSAKVAFGSVDVPEHVLCRRYKMNTDYAAQNPVSGKRDKIKTNPFGAENQIEQGANPTDPQVSFMGIKGLDDKWVGLLANYSLHYVGDWDNGTISADYFGEFSRCMQEKLKADGRFVAMMSNGTSGDVNIWDFKNPDRYPKEKFQKSKLIGNDIAEKIVSTIKELVWDENPAIASSYTEVALTLRKPSAEELKAASKIVIESNYEGLLYSEEILEKLYAREQILLNDLPDTVKFPIQALKIGKGIIGGLGAEIFAETGLWLKENSKNSSYFTVGLANGNAGYVPPKHEFEKGGYETWRSRASKLQEDAEEIIKQQLLRQINELSEEN